MPRPHKNRMVSQSPQSTVYKPAGVRASELGWVTLSLDEYETVKLLDYQGMDQAAAAEVLGVSRPTVTRIYASARKKIATVLAEGLAMRIEGGPVIHRVNCPRGGAGRGRGGFGRRRGRCSGGRMEVAGNENDLKSQEKGSDEIAESNES